MGRLGIPLAHQITARRDQLQSEELAHRPVPLVVAAVLREQGQGMGVNHTGGGIVDDFPAGFQNPFRPVEIFGELARGERHLLPSGAAYGGTDVGESANGQAFQRRQAIVTVAVGDDIFAADHRTAPLAHVALDQERMLGPGHLAGVGAGDPRVGEISAEPGEQEIIGGQGIA